MLYRLASSLKCGDVGMAAFAAGRHGLGAHLVAELDHRDEAVSAGAVPLLRARIGARAEGGQRAPLRGGEADGNARPGIVERLDDVAGEALEAVDVAPRRLPGSEVGLRACRTPPRATCSSCSAGACWRCHRRRDAPPRRASAAHATADILAPEHRERRGNGVDAPAQIPLAQQRDLLGQFRLQRIRRPERSSQALISAGIGFSNHGR